jgi:hypothetical protein
MHAKVHLVIEVETGTAQGLVYMVALLGKELKGSPNSMWCQGLLILSGDDGQWTSMVCVEGQVGWWIIITCCQRVVDGKSKNTQGIILRSGLLIMYQETMGKVWAEMVRYSHTIINHGVIHGFTARMNKIRSNIAALHSTTTHS